MENNKVKVRIYGQEYTIAGEKDEETIRKIAGHVDEKMRQLGRSFSNNGQGALAVLTAINIAEEYFGTLEAIDELKESKVQLEKETEHYLKMWDEAKKSFTLYKENAEEKKAEEDRYSELEKRCSEFESSFFDLQMENLQLKNELEKYRKSDEI